MLLSSIQVQGFKSFADKTTLKFGKGITAVVGPNGSGKSNISDAVRWVLGEQSSKSLRGQSMEDVIFGGTDTRRPHGFCEVTLNIDNADRTLNFDNDFVSVTRRYYRSHESEYLINNVSVRLKDVHELFMDTGLGRDGYSMIGQGKIDNIISTKSDERRDIFEEASGISKYRYRKTEAERKLLAAEDNLLRLKDIMDELESRVGPLYEQSQKAEKFLELAENKKKLEISLWMYTLNNSKEALRNHESKIAAAQMLYKDIDNALSEFDSKVEANATEFARYTTLIEQERTAISIANENIVKLEGDITVINNDIQHNTEFASRLNNEKIQLNISDADAVGEIDDKKRQLEQKDARINQLKDQLKNFEQQLTALLTDSEGISNKIEEQIKKLNLISAEISDNRVAMVTADTSIEEITTRHSNLEISLSELNAEKEALAKELGDTNSLLAQIEDKITSYNNSLKGYELRLNSRRETLDKLSASTEELRLDTEANRRRLQILKELENNMEGFSHSVKFVINESKKGILPNIHGTVSKLISVDQKYSVAIETALGNNIQNIVVDSESDAKRTINYLKKNNAGRATFLPIDTIKAKDIKNGNFDGMLGYVGVASDLVDTDRKYSEIVKFLLSGTIVTEDIDSAVAIAKKTDYKVKIVTLDGQIINLGGSLTGGSLVKQAGLLSRTTDINKLSDKLEKLENKLKISESDLEGAKAALSEADADITAIKADLTTATEDKIRTLAELKRLEMLVDNNERSLQALLTEQNEGFEKINSLKEASALYSSNITKLEQQKTSVQLEIDKMTNGRNSISEHRDILSENITNTKLSLVESEKDKAAILLNISAFETAIGDRKQRADDIDAELATVAFKNDSLNNEIKNFLDNIDDLKQKINEHNLAIEKYMSLRNDTEKFGVELRTSEREQTLEREKISGELARLNARKEVMVNEYDEVIRKLYDEYELTKSEAEAYSIELEKPNEAKKELADIKAKIRSLGNVNVSAIEEYKEVKERYDFLKAQIDDVEASRKELYKLINQLTSQMQELFIVGFDKINQNFKKTFTELFGGGEASLKLTDPDNILESGIDIEARLPGKNVPSLDGLSGGEKALVALSIYFAIMQVSPPPFCFLDEVDTALDDINVDRFAEYMKQSGFATQFICVTHRRGTMEAADMLYGVTMQEKGVTKLLELNVSELEKKLLENKGA